MPLNIDRRTLLIGGGAGVGLVVAFLAWPRRLRSDLAAGPADQAFGNFIRIARGGRITVAVPQTETGQGIWTALPQIVADELGAAWETVAVEPAPMTGAYANPLAREAGWLAPFGALRAHRLASDGRMRITAGSTSVRGFAAPFREAAAVAREMLIGAAADRWNVSASECETADGFVTNGIRTVTLGELAEEAASRTPPRRPTLRRGNRGRLAGKALERLDGPAKCNGTLRFAGDVRLPDMLFASARLAPPGGRLTGYSREALEREKSVRHVAASDRWIAVAADSWWQAERALAAANATFSAAQSGVDVRPVFEKALRSDDAQRWFSRGDYAGAISGARPREATYYAAPSQHLPVESISATARLTDDALELWVATQAPHFVRMAASGAAGLPESSITLYPMPVGSASGSALEAQAAPIAIALARSLKRPVQVTLPHHAAQNSLPLAPGAIARMSALTDASGIPAAWAMRVATGDGIGASIARLAGIDAPRELGATALDGAVPPYAIPNLRIESVRTDLPFLAGYMRGSPQREFTFFTESFIDELARAAGQEPLAFRMSMLGPDPRLARCFQSAAQSAGWDGGARGSAMGIAGTSAFGSHIALVASASVGETQQVRVHRLVAAVDCGALVNPGIAVQQVEAGLLWAIAQANAEQPEFVAGMPRARPLGGIDLPRLGDIPEIMVQLIPSSAPPGGLSGLAPAVVAPAVANAIFAATGKRMRALPFDPMGAQ